MKRLIDFKSCHEQANQLIYIANQLISRCKTNQLRGKVEASNRFQYPS